MKRQTILIDKDNPEFNKNFKPYSIFGGISVYCWFFLLLRTCEINSYLSKQSGRESIRTKNASLKMSLFSNNWTLIKHENPFFKQWMFLSSLWRTTKNYFFFSTRISLWYANHQTLTWINNNIYDPFESIKIGLPTKFVNWERNVFQRNH